MTMQNIISFLILICAGNCAVPSYFKVCHRNDPQVGACITRAVYDLLPRLRVGIPAYDIPRIEPLKIADVNFTLGNEASRVRANITNISVYGGSTFKIMDVSVNPNKNVFHFKVTIPHLRVESDYDIDAKVLVINIVGKGPMHANLTDFYFDCKLKGNKIQRQGVDFLTFQKMKCLIQYKKAHAILENLFENNPTIGKSTNDVINDNLDVFIEALKPSLVDAITGSFTEVANKIATKFNYNEFFSTVIF